MISRIPHAAIISASLALAGTSVTAQESTNRVAEKTDWDVYVDANPTECWSVSVPKNSVNTKDGRLVSVTRGDILLMVFYRPAASVAGQVAFRGGYDFREGSTVTLEIGDTQFELFTEGEWAWPATPADDAKIVTAMKRGSDAVVSGVSQRSGTQTKDTFSLLGFTAAVEDAETRCTS